MDEQDLQDQRLEIILCILSIHVQLISSKTNAIMLSITSIVLPPRVQELIFCVYACFGWPATLRHHPAFEDCHTS